jgi:hypothetical protein
MAVAAQVTSWAAQRGRAAAVARSTVPRRPSRDPIQAATPATNGPKSMMVCPWPMFQNVRSTQNGGWPVLGR